MSKGIKTAATETQLGGLHNLVYRVFKYKLDSWIKLMEQGADPDIVVDNKQISVILKFLEGNAITALPEEDESGGALNSKLEEIRAKQQRRVVGNGTDNVYTFKDEE